MVAVTMLRILFIFVLLALNGCVFDSPLKKAESLAFEHAFKKEIFSTPRFDLMTFMHMKKGRKSLVVYIEGDGLSWRTRHQPSADPSPRNPVGLELAVLDPSPSVVYIARPGQFVGGIAARNCDISLWTSHRYSEHVVTALNQAVSQAKVNAGAKEVQLVGYSGGGALVVLLAARREDVVSIRTVAGNLDHAAWTSAHGVTPLFGSLNAVDSGILVRHIHQVHYIGERDDIILPGVVNSYIQRMDGDPDKLVRIIPEAEHSSGWATVWPALCRVFYQGHI